MIYSAAGMERMKDNCCSPVCMCILLRSVVLMIRSLIKKAMLRYCVKIGFLFFMLQAVAFAQSVHFSQFRVLPNVINPAFTGFFNGDMRAGIVYRNQSPTYDNAFNTLGFGADFS